MKKLTIIIPTYNDGVSIVETLDSIVEQTYSNWEVIIIDDGGSDGTGAIVKKYKNEKDKNNQIKYFYQENQDQLNAVRNALSKINETDYIFILHSDDMFNDNQVVENAINYLENNKEYDGIIADLTIMDKDSKVCGIQRVANYQKLDRTLALQLLWLGRNLYCDVAFTRYEVFKSDVKENYLIWNMPFWLFKNNKNEMLNIKKVNFPFIKYRVFEGNYINNEIGKLNVINGELRTATRLMEYYHIPFYILQYNLFRLLNKLSLMYVPIFYKKSTKDKSKILKFILEKRYHEKYKNNLYLHALYLFYKNYQKRTIEISNIVEEEKIYLGSDMRLFNNNLVNNNLSRLYLDIFKEMRVGFDEILTNKENYEKIIDLIKFLNIYPYVKVTFKND